MQDLSHADTKVAVKAKWIRGFYMLVFLICGWVAVGLAIVVTIFQFVSTLIVDSYNENLCRFGKSLSQYFSQLVQYLTYNTEEKPFPFSAWPADAKKETLGSNIHPKTSKENKF